MNLESIPKDIDPLVILGSDVNDYLVVYTVLGNEEVIEMLHRTIKILETESDSGQLTKH
jgi:hypothetical protein